MGYIRKGKDGEFDFDNLPEGVYFFSGQEGFVKVEVDKDGYQSWDLQNWFASLDPDKNEEQHQKIIQDIKRRLNKDTGMINPSKKQGKTNLLVSLVLCVAFIIKNNSNYRFNLLLKQKGEEVSKADYECVYLYAWCTLLRYFLIGLAVNRIFTLFK